MNTLYESNLKEWPLLLRGKVRDVYDLGTELLIVTTDRISAFDVILPTPIPGKGAVLTKLTEFWLDKFKELVPNHLAPRKISDVIPSGPQYELLKDRAMVVKKAKPLPVECVVRGYLLGTGYKDYQKSGKVCGIHLPPGLKLAQKLPAPIFTPATKAEIGAHDENIPFEEMAKKIGAELSGKVRDISLKLYTVAAQYAERRGILIADTKFEFGLWQNQLLLIDEVLTPDSSRFWSVRNYSVGKSPPSFDKQIVRDYLETLEWNKKAPAPELPDEIRDRTARRYQEVLEILCHNP